MPAGDNTLKYVVAVVIVLFMLWMFTGRKVVQQVQKEAPLVKIPSCDKGWTHSLFHPDDNHGRCLKDCPTGFEPDKSALLYCIDDKKVLMPEASCPADWSVVDDSCTRPQMAPRYQYGNAGKANNGGTNNNNGNESFTGRLY